MTEYFESELQMQSKLIMFIENTQSNKKLFVGWTEVDNYYVRGIDENQNIPFGFYIETLEDCFDFIQMFFNYSMFNNIIVYNYNNMMYWDTNDLTYDFFESCRDDQYAILKCVNDIIKVLTLLKRTYNYEEETEEYQ